MPNSSWTQQRLAESQHFISRLANNLAIVALSVIEESEQTANHAQRENYARFTVLPNPRTIAAQIAPWFVQRVNVMLFETSFEFELNTVITASGDPDIQSQLLTDWDLLAGV